MRYDLWGVIAPEEGRPGKMLGPAVNRQPGFRRGTRRAKQRFEEQCLLQTGRCCNLAADLPDQLAGHRFAAVCRPCCRLGSLAARSLSVFLSGSPGWLAALLARSRWLALAGADCRNNCWLLPAGTGWRWLSRRLMLSDDEQRELNMMPAGAAKRASCRCLALADAN